MDDEGMYLNTLIAQLSQLKATDDYTYEISGETYPQEQCTASSLLLL